MKLTLKLMLKVILKVMLKVMTQKVMINMLQQQFEQIIQFLHNADCFILKLTLWIKEKMGMLDFYLFCIAIRINVLKFTYFLISIYLFKE
jgi:hypothetical protein